MEKTLWFFNGLAVTLWRQFILLGLYSLVLAVRVAGAGPEVVASPLYPPQDSATLREDAGAPVVRAAGNYGQLRSRPQPLQPLLLLLLQPLLPVHLWWHASRVLLVLRPVRVGVLLLPVVLHLTKLLLVPRRPALLLLRGLLLRVCRWWLVLLMLRRQQPGLQLVFLLVALQACRAVPFVLPCTAARHAWVRCCQERAVMPLLLGWPVWQGLGSLLLWRLACLLAMRLLLLVVRVCPACMAA